MPVCGSTVRAFYVYAWDHLFIYLFIFLILIASSFLYCLWIMDFLSRYQHTLPSSEAVSNYSNLASDLAFMVCVNKWIFYTVAKQRLKKGGEKNGKKKKNLDSLLLSDKCLSQLWRKIVVHFQVFISKVVLVHVFTNLNLKRHLFKTGI